jgi:hypothetical protein
MLGMSGDQHAEKISWRGETINKFRDNHKK